MNNIEAVKEILKDPKNWINHPFKMGDITCDDYRLDEDKAAHQIDALYQKPYQEGGSPMYLDKDGQWKMKPQPNDDLLLNDEEMREWIAKCIFHEVYPVRGTDYWGITGTIDDEGWRKFEKHCFYQADQILLHCNALIEARERERILKWVLDGVKRVGAGRESWIGLVDTLCKSLEVEG
jgi:hypothetical protein